MTRTRLAIGLTVVLVIVAGIVVWRTSRGGDDFHGPSAMVQAAILPLVFAWGREKSTTASISLEPEDAASKEYLAAAGMENWQ